MLFLIELMCEVPGMNGFKAWHPVNFPFRMNGWILLHKTLNLFLHK